MVIHKDNLPSVVLQQLCYSTNLREWWFEAVQAIRPGVRVAASVAALEAFVREYLPSRFRTLQRVSTTEGDSAVDVATRASLKVQSGEAVKKYKATGELPERKRQKPWNGRDDCATSVNTTSEPSVGAQQRALRTEQQAITVGHSGTRAFSVLLTKNDHGVKFARVGTRTVVTDVSELNPASWNLHREAIRRNDIVNCVKRSQRTGKRMLGGDVKIDIRSSQLNASWFPLVVDLERINA